MNNEYKEKLARLVNGSALEDNEKKLWQLFLKMALPEENEAVYDAANEGQENLQLLTKYLGDKIRDMKKDNQVAWQKIAQEEKELAKFLD